MILTEESIKYTSNGVLWAMGVLSIALPPLLNYGSDQLKDRYCSKVNNFYIYSVI